MKEEQEDQKSNEVKNKYLSIEEFHDLIYLFEQETLEKDDVALRQGSLTDKMYIIESGRLEGKTDIKSIDTELKLVELTQGCILDHRNVHIDSELVSMTVTAKETTVVWTITKSKFDQWKAKYPKMGRQIDMHISDILKKQMRYIIDVILNKREKIKSDSATIQMSSKQLTRIITMKNVAFQCMLQYRIENKVNDMIYQRVKTKIAQLKEKGVPSDSSEPKDGKKPDAVKGLDSSKKEDKKIFQDKIKDIVNNADPDDSKQNDHLGVMYQELKDINIELAQMLNKQAKYPEIIRQILVAKNRANPPNRKKDAAGVPRIDSEPDINNIKKM